MPLPEKEYFALEEIEERWGIQRRDTIYYAENGLLAIAVRVVGVVLEAGVIETEPDGRWFKIPEDRRRFCGLLPLQEHHLSRVFLSGAAHIDSFRADGGRYIDLVEPESGVEVCLNALIVTRAERDRFERAHGLTGEYARAQTGADQLGPAVACSDDGGWIRVHRSAYVFTGCLHKAVIRRLWEAWRSGAPKLNRQAVLEEIESRSRHVAQVFSGADPRWREIVGYGRGHIWLKVDD